MPYTLRLLIKSSRSIALTVVTQFLLIDDLLDIEAWYVLSLNGRAFRCLYLVFRFVIEFFFKSIVHVGIQAMIVSVSH